MTKQMRRENAFSSCSYLRHVGSIFLLTVGIVDIFHILATTRSLSREKGNNRDLSLARQLLQETNELFLSSYLLRSRSCTVLPLVLIVIPFRPCGSRQSRRWYRSRPFFQITPKIEIIIRSHHAIIIVINWYTVHQGK